MYKTGCCHVLYERKMILMYITCMKESRKTLINYSKALLLIFHVTINNNNHKHLLPKFIWPIYVV